MTIHESSDVGTPTIRAGIASATRRLGLILSALSVVKLAQIGFNVGFGAVARAMLGWYDDFVGLFAGYIEPFVQRGLAELRGWTGWQLHLYPHWKHVFLLMWIYFAAQTRARTDRYIAEIDVLVGAPIALAVGVACGVVPLGQHVTDIGSNIFIASLPIVGVVLFLFCTRIVFFVRGGMFSLALESGLLAEAPREFPEIAIIGSLTIALSVLASDLPFLNTVTNTGLLAVAVFIVGIAMANVARASVWAARTARRSEMQTWSGNLWRRIRARAKVGMNVLTVVAGVVAFVAFNAGLVYAGL